MEKQVNVYIEKQKSPQKEILQKVRKIFHETLPNCEEKMAWGVPTFSSGKFYIAAMKNRVHVGFAITGLSEDENKLVKLIKTVNEKAICKSC
jgi:uncharacterized protein YdhG (YjbR/CyaY superfamily)